MKWKSIKVSEEIYKEIEALKIHHRQPAGEIIEKALGLLRAFKLMKKELVSQMIDEDESLALEAKMALKKLFDSI